jgi:hypothetical protein
MKGYTVLQGTIYIRRNFHFTKKIVYNDKDIHLLYIILAQSNKKSQNVMLLPFICQLNENCFFVSLT